MSASDLVEKVITFSQKHELITKDDKLVVGVSGGPDSLCLLHVLVNLSDKLKLHPPIVAHLNHKLRGEASLADEIFVRNLAANWQLPIFVESLDISEIACKQKQSIEEAARKARYTFLWRVSQKTNVCKVAVGHNADDQVETVLMHFIRGTGLVGLRGILPEVDLISLFLDQNDRPDLSGLDRLEVTDSPKLIRPLLEISRSEVEQYCRKHNLSPRQDDSNQDITLFRNRLRHELIPQLETYNPNIRQVIQYTARIITAETQILETKLERVWPDITCHQSSEKIEFDRQMWLKLPLAMKRSTLRRAIQSLDQGLRDIGFYHIENAINIIENGKTGAQATFPQNLLLIVGYQTIIITSTKIERALPPFPKPYLADNQVLKIEFPGITVINANWQVKARFIARKRLSLPEIQQLDNWEAYLDTNAIGDTIILRTRKAGDRFQPLGMGGRSKKINEFMIDEKIPARWRALVPLLVSGNQILWVCGYRSSEEARVKASTEQILHLQFEHLDSD